MKVKAIILLAVILFIAVVLATDQSVASEDAEVSKNLSARDRLAPPKLFDFARFKSMFKKRYSSVIEELARKKLFLGRAFKAFLSFIGYKHYKSSSYQKVHEMSDWTQEELRAMEMARDVDGTKDTNVGAQPAADLDEIEAKLREIVEKQAQEPGYAEIANELSKSTRRKRAAERSSLSIDYLLEDVELEQPSGKSVAKIESNNPEYEVPEITSFGSSDDNKPMEAEQSKLIVNLPGGTFLETLVSGAKSLFIGSSDSKPDKNNPNDIVKVDHRITECFTPVKNQRSCGSCYIFSTTALYEYTHCMETGKLVAFSEQYPLDCGDRIGMGGCRGGMETDVGNFYGVYGVELMNHYPYHPRADTCPYDSESRISKMGYLRLKERSLKTIMHYEMDRYIEKMPILRGLAVSDNFHHYGGGVDSGKDCNPKRGHSMLIVGSGTEDGVDYWLFRNSYGPSWGEKGHYKIAKDAANCWLDMGMGYVLEPTDGTVFDSVNPYNDGSEVSQRKYDNSFHLPSFLGKLIDTKPSDPNIVTPPPN